MEKESIVFRESFLLPSFTRTRTGKKKGPTVRRVCVTNIREEKAHLGVPQTVIEQGVVSRLRRVLSVRPSLTLSLFRLLFFGSFCFPRFPSSSP